MNSSFFNEQMNHHIRPSIAQTLMSLQARGLDRLDAQLLLLHVLGQAPSQRAWLLTHDTDELPEAGISVIEQLAKRRLTGEPLAYLTGQKEFYGLTLQVNPHVLVPRPETETLVQWVLDVLASKTDEEQHVLDLGTGSGAIALAIKAQQPALCVHAIDSSEAALALARANAQSLALNIQFSQGSWFAGLPDTTTRFVCVVSNPPYIAEQDPHLTALTHEPLQALTSGMDGLDDIRHIIAHAPAHILPGGWLLLEHGYNQATAVRDILQQHGFQKVQSRCDLAGIERCSGGQYF
jgi:release factor glutamine methyltransferase